MIYEWENSYLLAWSLRLVYGALAASPNRRRCRNPARAHQQLSRHPKKHLLRWRSRFRFELEFHLRST